MQQLQMDFKHEHETNTNSKYRWLNEVGLQFLERDYLKSGQTLDERVDVICAKAESILRIPGFAKKFKENIQKGWYSLSTPIWTNFGNERGLGISCFGSYITDDMDSILYTNAEVGKMSQKGGGTSGYFGNLRHKGADITDNGKSSGAVHFMRLFDTTTNIVSQGSARRGSFAAYLPLDHKDIMEYLMLRREGNAIQDLSFGVTVPEGWMQQMIDGDLEKKKVWAKVLESRSATGFPYILFADNANNNTVDVYKDLNMKIVASNLCSEIMLPSSAEESFVCDLSSMNILYFDEWKDTDAVELLVFFLDAVMTEFIEKAKNIKYMERAVRFAERHRAIGVGWLGWHSYLQSKMIAFESVEAKAINVKVAKTIRDKCYAASAKLAQLFGEPELLKGRNRRNTTLNAIAPTKSSSWILGQASEGIEAQESNAFIKDLAKGKYTFKNPYLKKLLAQKDKDTDQVWQSILANRGSVQHLDFLSVEEKNVFKTFSEISMMEVIIQAAARQKYIDQGQSLNIKIHPKTHPRDINMLMVEGWRLGIKAFYYQKSINAAQEFTRELVECASCSA